MTTLRTQWQSYTDQQNVEPSTSPGVCYLPELGVVRFSGADTLAFLQGYLTCDTLELAADALTPTAICNLKGRVVVNGWCMLKEDESAGVQSVLLIVHRSLIERLAAFFKAYLMFSKTKLTDETDATLTFGLTDATAVTQPCALAISDNQGLLLIDKLSDAKQIWEGSNAAATWWWLGLIRAGIPVLCEATSETFLPQMLNLEQLGAVDFDKGCYLGQEVVARAQHRGEVKRRLQMLEWRGPTTPGPGAALSAAGDAGSKLGTVVNAAATGNDSGICLGVVGVDSPGPFQHSDTVLNRIG